VRDKPLVWKHSCVLHGQGTLPDGSPEPCSPPCDEPWSVDYPGPGGAQFATLPKAMDHANMYARAISDPEGKSLVEAIHKRKDQP